MKTAEINHNTVTTVCSFSSCLIRQNLFYSATTNKFFKTIKKKSTVFVQIRDFLELISLLMISLLRNYIWEFSVKVKAKNGQFTHTRIMCPLTHSNESRTLAVSSEHTHTHTHTPGAVSPEIRNLRVTSLSNH